MKHILLTTIAAVVLVGCGPSIHEAAKAGNIEAAKKAIAAGADVNAKDEECATSLDWAKNQETADLLRKHGGKTAKELKFINGK